MFSTKGLLKGSMALLLVSAFASQALGQATLSADATSGDPGATATTTLSFTGDGTQSSVSANLFYDETVLTPQTTGVDVDGCLASLPMQIGGLFTSCRSPTAGQIVIILTAADAISPMPNAPNFGTITWEIAPTAVPVTDNVILDLVSIDTTPGTAADLQTVDGAVDINAPAGDGFYASTPAPGENVNLGEAVVNSTATAVDTLNVQNLSPDTDFDITAFNGPAILGFPATSITVGFGTDQDVPIDCTPTARGDNGGSFTVTHDAASGATSPVTYTFDCDGLAPNVTVPAGPVAISGLTVDPNPLTATFDVTNPDDGFTSDAMNVMASAAGDGVISVAPAGPLTIARDGMETFTVSCDNSAAGSFSSLITIAWDNPVTGGTAIDTIDATCDVSNAVASFDSDPTAPGPLAFGTVTNGTTSAPIGIDVFNDGVGPAPASDLTISNVLTSAGQFQATLVNAGPFVVGAGADGTADIEVTCTPDAGAGALTGTLTVEHDGDDSPTLFDLTCEGESDGTFASSPAAGGTLNLGAVLPQNTTPEGFIDFTNNGSVDDLTVDCSVSSTADVFTINPDPISFTIAPGATASAGFQCTPPTIDAFSADVACTIGGDPDVQTADFTVVCQGRPMVIPTMSRWGLVVMSLMLLLVAGFAGRRMLA